MKAQQIIEQELNCSIDFFLETTNLNPASRGFGLALDSTKDPHISSIASVGFALTGWVIAYERNRLTRTRALEITRGTLRTLLENVPHHRGFFAHFLNMETAERLHQCEYSTIDTAICLNGVITAAAYFDDAEIQQLAQSLLNRVDWNFIVFEKEGKALFRMAYNPDRDGDYVRGDPGFIHQWDMAAEQKMMYLQAAPYLSPETARALYAGFNRDVGEFQGKPVIINPGGNLFCYQLSEAWLDVRTYLDPDGVDWFENTRLATLADRAFCIQNASRYRTYHANSWGLNAGDSPFGYRVYGSAPSLHEPEHDGTVSIAGALASLPFASNEVLSMAEYLYHQHPQTWGRYGFFDAYNLDVLPPWYGKDIYGFNKGLSMIMIENYLSGLVWDVYTHSPLIQSALDILRFVPRKEVEHGTILR